MASTRQQVVFTFSTASGGETYLYDVVVDAQSLVSVRNMRTPYGLITDSATSLPDVVVGDMNDAKTLVTQLLAETQVDSGNLVFAGDVTKTATIAADVLNNTNYRVVYTTPDGTPLRTTDKTVTSFIAEAATTYGTAEVPITVGYVVLVAAQGTSPYNGTVTFEQADAGTKEVEFPSAMSTSAYHVILSPDGFFPVRVSARTRASFTLTLGYTLGEGETAVVGFDVFV
jgi:hypothetical protein